MIKFTIKSNPVTKKNSGRILKSKSGKPFVAPSRAFEEYQELCGYLIPGELKGLNINTPINIQAIYYRDSRRTVDITNLHSALHDILVHYNVIADDNMRIVIATDGNRVRYDKDNPRTEIEISELEEETGF